jgi:hypothetical protein
MANRHCQWAAGKWAVLGLQFSEDSVTALLDGEPLTTREGIVAGAGVCGFGSGWHEAHFSDFELAELAGHPRAPGSFLHDLLPPNRTTVQSFTGQWAGMVLDVGVGAVGANAAAAGKYTSDLPLLVINRSSL